MLWELPLLYQDDVYLDLEASHTPDLNSCYIILTITQTPNYVIDYIHFRMIKLNQIYKLFLFFSDCFLQDAVLLDLEAFPWENKAYVFLAYFFVSYHVPMPVSIWFLFLLFISFSSYFHSFFASLSFLISCWVMCTSIQSTGPSERGGAIAPSDLGRYVK